jgi:hypothetical protein
MTVSIDIATTEKSSRLKETDNSMGFVLSYFREFGNFIYFLRAAAIYRLKYEAT